MLPDPEYFGVFYHKAYKVSPSQLKKKIDWNKLKKKLTKFRNKPRNKIEVLYGNDTNVPPEIELPGNASAFAVFASIRLAVLDRWMHYTSEEYLHSSCGAPIQNHTEIESDTEDNSQSFFHHSVKISKVVGIGLRSVFELIRESRITHPTLCTKALLALLNVLQGQSPEGLKSEPSEVIDPLFDLLLDLATLHGPESSVPNDGNHLTALACACLLSLVVVRGDTGKFLSATAALLMCPRALALQNIKMSSVLCSLQRSVYGVLLEKNIRPDWITHGVPDNSEIDSFYLKLPNELSGKQIILKSLACDGYYFYLFSSSGLFKIGSGFGGTIKGHIILWKPDFYPNDTGVLMHCGGNLYLKLSGRHNDEVLIVDKTSLLITGSVLLHNKDASSSIIFSDGDYLGIISPAKDDSFVVRTLNQYTSPASVINELPLKLVKKCIEVFGAASFEEEIGNCSFNVGNEEEVVTIAFGKEFGLLRTFTGKVLYCGKSSSLGMKQSGVRTRKWSELNLTKSPKISHIAIGHDGLHAILVTEDGSVFFTGTARRGEDGDQSKVRRQIKPIKPKKMIKVDGYHIVGGTCNNGTTALITSNGELIMFGKDTAHTDPVTGIVTSLKGTVIVQVALGKAHGLALTNKGQLYTFGINNKYQCGRDFMFSKDENASHVTAMETCGVQEEYDFCNETTTQSEDSLYETDENLTEFVQNICQPGMHSWHDDMCMICSVCQECTGYSVNCLSSISSERNPGQECGCGEGDSGCAICGCCRICAHEVVDNSDLADLAEMMKFDLLSNDKVSMPQKWKVQEQIQCRLEAKKNKSKKSIQGFSKQQMKSKFSRSSNNSVNTIIKTESTKQISTLETAKDQYGSDVERDASRVTCLPPAKISLPSESPVVQIACGLHHSIVLLRNGQVYTFGSNLYGQLGSGDILSKSTTQFVKLPCSAVQIAAGSNHSVILTSNGEVYTFGNAQKGQLGRMSSDFSSQNTTQPGHSSTSRYNNPRTPWYSSPGPIPNIGPRHGRIATWIGASGDQTFLKLDENLINSISITKSTIIANKKSIILLPKEEEISRNFKCIAINKKDGICNSFKNQHQVDFTNKVICMDHIYNVVWSFDPSTNAIMCYNIIASELQTVFLKEVDNKSLYDVKTTIKSKCSFQQLQLPSILSPELALPAVTNCYVTRFQAAINLLCCLDILTTAYELHLPINKEDIEDNQFLVCKQYSKEDFQVINRFENYGGGWGYSGHSIEAIRFMTDTNILLGGFGLFGGRGEYTAKLKLIDIGTDGGEQEIDGELLAETEDIQYECGPRQKFPVLFEEPIHLQAHRWYVAWCRINGPSSDCGSSGQTMVITEEQVIFYFKSSKKSNNGTDVNAGQIPQLLYKIISHENQSPPKQIDVTESTHILSKDFSRTVSKECFQSLLSLLQWSWNTFKWGVIDDKATKNLYNNLELERLVYISKASLRLICTYVNEIYPRRINKRIPIENVTLAECVGDTRTLLKQILSDNIPMANQMEDTKINTSRNLNMLMLHSVLDECHNTFVSCFHAFYPTANLKWNCLCELLAEVNKVSTSSNAQRLLSAILCALSAPYVRLRNIFPLMGSNINFENSFHRILSSSDNNSLPIMSRSDSHHYPILVEQIVYKTQVESNSTFNYQWNDVLECLINLAANPVLGRLRQCDTTTSPELTKYCCHLLAKVVAELVIQCSTTEEEFQSYGHTLYITPSRFTRINQSRTWNTGNGSPDAVCFQVDREGISITGAGVYGGIGHYEYELELLEDSNPPNGENQVHAHRWNSLEVSRGSYGPEDFAPDIIEIKFERPIPIKENVKYAIRLRNHGGRTNNGDGGITCVRGPDNTTFTFSTCSLSFNGTTLTRGQIPVLLYYSNPLDCGKYSATKSEEQARKAALSVASKIICKANNLMVLAREQAEEVMSSNILSTSNFITCLLPLVLAHISPLATSDSNSTVHILNLIKDMLPHVAALNLMETPSPKTDKCTMSSNSSLMPDVFDNKNNTTSRHYTLVESDHPYKPSTVTNYRVKFPESVKWMSLEFDPACSTIQPEDSLQLYVPAVDYLLYKKNEEHYLEATDNPPLPYWPVLHKFSGSLQWPTNSIILPGNEVIFSLETASDYLKDERFSAYGFKCLIIGYDWPLDRNLDTGLKRLEAELSFLGGMCTASLMKRDLLLPAVEDEGDVDMEVADVIASEIFAQHGSLLAKGLALSSPPTVQQALDGVLPYSVHSNERLFLRDFVNCTAGSSGGRLAQWLQPGSRVDPSKCQVLYSREELHCGWPAMITLLIRDQYSEMVHVSNMKVELKAVPIDKRELGQCDVGCKMRKVSQPDPLAFGGLPPPPLHHLYEPTIRDKMCFHSITVMKHYQNYSFEELRYACPPMKKSLENMLVRYNGDGTYSATWTPASIGYYSIIVNIDGYEMEEIFKVEVKEPPQGMTPPNQNTAKKASHKPNRLRKFVAKYSAGLRIRAHPSLQSEQIGIVHVNGTISFIDEIHNDDGVWVRLSADTIKQYCTVSVIEAWCLQYNQHLGRTLLLPVEESKTILDKIFVDTIMRKFPEIQERRQSSNSVINYEVIKCGASGHNIRSRPSLKAPPIGMLALGNRVGVTEYTINSDGCWVLLDEHTKEKYCFNAKEDAWSLAIGQNNVLYLGSINDSDNCPKLTSSFDNPRSEKKGFNFSSILKSGDNFSFSAQNIIHTASSKSPSKISSLGPFIFGENTLDSPKLSNTEKKDIKTNSLSKSFKGDVKSNGDNVSIKHTSECNANGNRVTASDGTMAFQSATPVGQSSCPLGILSSGISQSRRGSNHSEVNAVVRDVSPSSSETIETIKISPISGGNRPHTQLESSLAPTAKNDFIESEQIQHKQTGTQTSPDNTNAVAIKAHFSIGVTGKDEKISPKLIRKDRTVTKMRSKRAISPAQLQQLPTNLKMICSETESVKQAMSPSLAESLRAVFAAFLWHEGIVHDAMACASFLKFHPTLPKHGAPVVTRNSELTLNRRHKEFSKDEKAMQRHSVEVASTGNYLHIQPSTLESLTRSAANANANRNRKKVAGGIIDKGEKLNEDYGYQKIAVLPPALKSLVYLWEEVTSNCLLAVSQQMISTSPIQTRINKCNKSEVSGQSESREKNDGIEKGVKKCKKKKVPSRNYLEDIGLFSYLHSSGADILCELCGDIFPRPVTHHMHQAHPGCGQHAGGKGYNSGGNYCLGWAGNCGDGGVPGSSWYLLCDSCRQKYVKTNMGKNQINIRNKCTVRKSNYTSKVVSPSLVSLEPHIIMKNNAMFLLDVESSAESHIRRTRRSSVTIMPSLSEHNSPPEIAGPFGPLPPFQCLSALDGNISNNEDLFFSDLLNKYNLHKAAGPSRQRPLSEVTMSESDSDNNRGLRFHRSVSMGTNGTLWSKSGYESRIAPMRKRNNSNCEITNESGSSLLCNPSNALQKLTYLKGDNASIVNSEGNAENMDNFKLLQRPVLNFILQHHDLDSLQCSMRRALRKAMCRVYAMQALNWLLRSVTQPVCLHDLLWWFVTSLTPVEMDTESEEDNRPLKKEDEQDMTICEHPLSDIYIAGEAVHPLPSTFHSLLQTIADLMVLLPMGSALQQVAVRCWGIRFTSTDHSFLHRSQVFSNISKILSRSEEIEAFMMQENYQKVLHEETPSVECLKDLTSMTEIKASSRQAMVGSLTDNSTETFWESGDEDRNKTKIITIICTHGHHPTLVCVHIDSCRDIGNKVSSITFSSGQNTEELVKLRTVEVESRLLGGWVNCPITEPYNNVIRLELRGPDNSVRVRQIRVLGNIEGESLQVGKQYNYLTLQQKNCEAETLRVFRLITSQVFGKLLQGEDGQNLNDSEVENLSLREKVETLEESNDLKEHMVGILFSRSKLTHLQKQVIVHIVQAIRKETERVHEEWESNLSTSTYTTDEIITNSDNYCFEMLSMVMALSGSSVGRTYLSHQHGLLKDLVILLHTGSARVQRQVTSLLRRMMPEISPEIFAKIVGVKILPAKDFSIITAANKNFNSEKNHIDELGILDVFLSIIAKALTLQVKIRGKNGNIGISKEINTISLSTTINQKENLLKKWWLKGSVNKNLAEIIISLIKDMASGKMSETWAKIAKGAIAEKILGLTYLNDEQKLPNNCVQTATLWLALASLCVLDKDHVERLSSGQWLQSDGQPMAPRPTCDNHDDGETIAIIQCNLCGNLCAECDRYLHLHRKARNHQRQICKEEEEAIKVELHEGCGRTKLFWLLALVDSRTLKALIEFREGGPKKIGVGISGLCRFCGATGNSGLLAIGNICADHECQEYGKIACNKLLNCGHICGGVLGESKCLPCLHGCFNHSSLKQDSDDMCMICFTEALSCAPAIQLKCGHVFHYHCCKEILMKKWVGPRITFSFLFCPICKEEIFHEMLEQLLTPSQELYNDVRRKALMRLEYEGLHNAEAISTPGTSFHNDTASYAMERYAYYMCYKCNKAYYGGEVRCDAELGDNYDPTELICGACSDVARAQMCPKHGTDFLEYKCRYCCSVAIFFCFGTTHFCNLCHDDFQRVTNLNKSELPACPAGPRAVQLEGDECPLLMKHPPTGEEFALGCGVCRNTHTF